MYRLLNECCMKTMGRYRDASFHTLLADPPYGIRYKSRNSGLVLNDDNPYIWWLREAWRVTKPGGVLLCYSRWDVSHCFETAIAAAGYRIRSQVVWDKMHHGMGDTRAAFSPRHEIIWFATKGKFVFPGRRPASVIRVPRVTRNQVHPMQKPVEVQSALLDAVTPNGGRVMDPFMGSGSAALAALQLGLDYVGSEMDATYYKQAVKRLRMARRTKSRRIPSVCSENHA